MQDPGIAVHRVLTRVTGIVWQGSEGLRLRSVVFALLNEVSPLPGLCWVEVDLVL